MSDVKPAPFQLERTKIKRFEFIEPDTDNIEMVVRFDPVGVYHESESKYTLAFNFTASNGDSTPFVNVIMESYFKFMEPVKFEDLPSYFYKNIIAIVFPYLRSFITTLTVLANDKALILPIMNLSNLEQDLKKSTTKA